MRDWPIAVARQQTCSAPLHHREEENEGADAGMLRII